MTTPSRPITILIAALGGEGGGVLTDWIVVAAGKANFMAQSTSIPGVAQRTGATTYYIEIVPVPLRELAGRRPILALAPGIGDVDLVVASELMEAGRTIAGGFVTRDRTFMIASTSRCYLVAEKMAMGDGRYDQDRLLEAIIDNARDALLLDLEDLAKQSGAMINAVILGTIAGSGTLPIPVEAFEQAIRDGGKGVEANLRGFRAGLAAARAGAAAGGDKPPDKRSRSSTGSAIEREIAAMPAAARDVVAEGVRRLVAYQDAAYARRYLDRLAAICAADAQADAGGKLLRETARHLAVRMSYEDVIRVAEAKIDPARLARIEKNMGVKPGEPYSVVEFLKPGIAEICQILPVRLARAILTFSERRGWLASIHWGMEINTTSVFGYLRFLMLAKFRRWRPKSYRFHEEQAAIDTWLGLIADAAKISPELALEVAECARLIKGYGDTHKRGTSNYRAIEARVIRPVLAGRLPARLGADALASARAAALLDPEGEGLAKCLAAIERQPNFAIAAE